MSKLTLLLDTATPILQMGLAINGDLRYHYREGTTNHRQHSAMLLPQIQTGLQEIGKQMTDINRVAVNIGPGSFTGLRTGITTARTIGQFMPITIHAINAFEILAVTTPSHHFINALRGRAYHAELSYSEGNIQYQTPPELIDHPGPYTDLPESIPPMVTLVQAGVGICPWQTLLPLYLQDPNITQRNPRPGRMK